MSLLIRPLSDDDLMDVKEFTDLAIGDGYFSIDVLKDTFSNSVKNNISTSFVLESISSHHSGLRILGIRLAFPPQRWKKGDGAISPYLWKVPLSSVGYFQSIFLASDLTGRGWGQRLSQASVTAMKQLGAQAVVCHSWVESPHDSSRRYLKKLNFETVRQHTNFWINVDYICPRCTKPCVCTAEEMILYL